MELDFNVQALDKVVVEAGGELANRDLMSPYVWKLDKGGFAMMVRGVPREGAPASDTGMIWYGESDDGLTFIMEEAPILAPTPNGPDAGGCEDPTLVVDDGRWIVYYTGVDAAHQTGQMFYATGTGPHDLTKQGIALASSKTEGNTKEATIAKTPQGQWRLFYEFARDNASLVGLALGDGVAGPWHEQPQPFAPRPECWDGWHLSTGPMLTEHPDVQIMFYNGATQDARWRIGWVAFDKDCKNVVDRCIEPLIVPPPRPERAMIDIAFAASCVMIATDISHLYYSVGDRELERAIVKSYRQ